MPPSCLCLPSVEQLMTLQMHHFELKTWVADQLAAWLLLSLEYLVGCLLRRFAGGGVGGRGDRGGRRGGRRG